MKKLALLLAVLCFTKIVTAQKKYTIDATGKIGTITTNAEDSYIFSIDIAHANKSFKIINTVNGQGNMCGYTLGKEISKDAQGGFTITILPNRKVKESQQCQFDINDDFTIELDDKSIGSFKLKPAKVVVPGIVAPSLTPIAYYSGSIIYDALYISLHKKNPAEKDKILALLESQYGIKNASDKNNNAFLESQLADALFASRQAGIDVGSIFSTIGGADVSKVADGFVKFFIDRATQELSIAFFRNFRDNIKENKDLNALFPKTAGLLAAMDTQISQYSNYLNNLRAAFKSDLLIIDERVPLLVKNHEAFFNEDKNQPFKVALLSGSYIATSVKNKVHPGDILQDFPTDVFNDNKGALIPQFNLTKASLQTLQLFSESLKEVDTTRHAYWVDIKKVRELVNNPDALQIYLGLIIQTAASTKYNKIPFSATTNNDLYTFLNNKKLAASFSTDYNNYKEYIIGIATQADILNNSIDELSQPAPDSLRIEQYTQYFNSVIQLFRNATKISKLKFLAKVTDIDKLEASAEKYGAIVQDMTDMVMAINQKKYAEVANSVILLYNGFYALPASEKKDDDAQKANKTRELITKYSAFMANMINAKNSDEVANAIESAALPVGSASIKRETAFNVSLNGYLGFFAGNEIIKGVDANKPFSKFNSYGITAPIGVSVNWGDRLLPWPLSYLFTAKGWSSSYYFSVVDLGAIAAFRFEDDQTEQVPSIKLKDIISPGIFWSVGIAKTPISVNFGAQFGPNLRKVTDTSNDYSDKLYTRYSISVCVDIPLLNFYTKSKK